MVRVEAGICGFVTTINTSLEDGQQVRIAYDSDCPNVLKAKEELQTTVDAYQELFKKPHEARIYQILSHHLPHGTCPLYSAFMKAIELEAGLALPRDVHMSIEK